MENSPGRDLIASHYPVLDAEKTYHQEKYAENKARALVQSSQEISTDFSFHFTHQGQHTDDSNHSCQQEKRGKD